MTPIAYFLRRLVRIYQILISPALPAHCRFAPSCSEYAMDAISDLGAAQGSWLAIRRVIKCHPWGGHGYDPVPHRTGPDARSPLR